jgi:hypothetical protein
VRECPRKVQAHLLMCGQHWRMVPPALQGAVNDAYYGGAELRVLIAAQRSAVDAVNRQLQPAGGRDD